MKNSDELKIGFIGCGKMASAIIKGVIESKFLNSNNIIASEINEEIAEIKKNELKIEIYTENKIVAKNSDIIILATKPHFIKDVLNQITDELSKDKLIVSIAAGVSTKTIEEIINKEIAVIRVMPNAPALVQEGMSGIVKGTYSKDEHLHFIEKLLTNIGKCIIIEEEKIDILTAISGSGPAFFYKIIHEMAKAGEKLGLEYEKSLLLAEQTAFGSAKIMLESEIPAQELINNVATKGGCTEVGVQCMDNLNSEGLWFEVIEKTAQKSRDLG